VIWAVVALSATFWALRLLARSPSAPPHAAPAGQMAARGDLSRLFGSTSTASTPTAVAPAAVSRFRLIGVAAPKSGSVESGGVALIAIDGKPPRPFRVGASVDGDLTLRSVDLRTASLGPRNGSETVILEMPPRSVAATGTLPPAPSFGPTPSPAITSPADVAPQGAPQSQTSGPPRLRPTIVPGSEGLATPPAEGTPASR